MSAELADFNPDDGHLHDCITGSLDECGCINQLYSVAQHTEEAAGQVLRTAEEVEQLPDGSVIADRDDDIWQLRGGIWCSYETEPWTSAHIHAKWAPLTVLRRGGAA